MSDFVEQCRSEWRRLGVPDPLAEEMATDLASDLSEAEAEGVSADEFLGSSVFDPRSFAASWAAERGIIPAPPSRENARRRPLVLVAFTAVAAIALIVTALLLLTGQPTVSLVATRAHNLPFPRHHRPSSYHPALAGKSSNKRIRAGRVDPPVLRDRRARLRCMAVVEMGPLATTHRPGLAAVHAPPIARPVSGSKKCRARWSTTASTDSPSRTRVRGLNRPTRLASSGLQPCCELSDRTIVADVLGELANVVGDRLRRRDREVDEHLGAEGLGHLDAAVSAAGCPRSRAPRRRGPRAGSRARPSVRRMRRAPGAARVSPRPARACSRPGRSEAPFSRAAASIMFIAGLPMKPPTKTLTGSS